MKNLAVVLIFICPCFLFAQGVFTNHTHSALQHVIGDYPNKFRNIRGEVLSSDPQTTNYESRIAIPGSSAAVITKYSSTDDREVFSWKCEMATSEDFDEIAAKYKALHSQIRNSIVKIDGEKPFILNGAYEIPSEDKRFTTSAFSLLPSVGPLGRVRVELALEYFVTEWKISLLVYDGQEEALVLGE